MNRLLGLLLAGSLFTLNAVPAAAAEPALSIQIKSVDSLIADVKYFARLVNQTEAAEQLDGVISAWAGNDGLAGTGIDIKRPTLAYAIASAGGADSPFAVMLPISDEARFLKFLEGMTIKPEKKDGYYAVEVPSAPVQVYFRFANNYAYITAVDPANISDKQIVPADRLGPVKPNAVLAVNLHMDQIPDNLKQLILGQFELRLAAIKDRKNPDESAEQARMRRQGIDAMSMALRTLLSEGRSMQFSWNVDRANDDISIDALLIAKPETMLDTIISAMAGGKTRFAAAQNAAFHMGLNVAAPPALRAIMGFAIDAGLKDLTARESDPSKREILGKAIAAVTPTLKAGVVDLHIAACCPSESGPFNILAALGVQEGKAIEGVVKDIAKQLPQQERIKFGFDVTKHGDVNVHQLKVDNLDAEAKRIFGNAASVWAGFAPAAIMLGLGGDPAVTFDAVTARSNAESCPLLVIEGSISKMARLDKEPFVSKIADEVFGASPQGTDAFRLSLEGGKELKFSGRIKGRVLKFATTVDEKKKSAN